MTVASTNELPLSIIVISFSPQPILERCLAALSPQIESGENELLVIGRWPDTALLSDLRTHYPNAVFIEAPLQETIPQMRLRGIAEAQGRLIALLEDDCIVGVNWCQTISAVHQTTDQPAVGGAINPDNYPRLLDWAVYFCEYARFLGPFAGPVSALPGNNVSYKRKSLPPAETMPDGFYEVFLHWQWQQDGRTLLADPDLALTNINRWNWTNILTKPYQHGRSFAALRSVQSSPLQRLLRAALTPLLPILQVGRIIKEVAARGRHLTKLILALHMILLFQISWALGELIGNLFTTSKSGWH
jgi:hypothetical protein